MAKPVLSLSLVKDHLRVEHALDDNLITLYAAAAVDRVLDVIGLAGELEGDRQYEATTKRFVIRRLPVEAVKAVERWDGAAWVAIAESDWTLSGNVDLGFTIDISGTSARHRITIEHGFPTVMPATLQMAALFLTAHYYENRGAVAVGAGIAAVELPLSVKSLLDPWRQILFA
jgi:uncharacterized phiE125 gp8 family phage protein